MFPGKRGKWILVGKGQATQYYVLYIDRVSGRPSHEIVKHSGSGVRQASSQHNIKHLAETVLLPFHGNTLKGLEKLPVSRASQD